MNLWLLFGEEVVLFFIYLKKLTKWGFIIYCLCDSENGYCRNMIFDLRKDKKGEKGYTTNLFFKLVDGLENSGRNIFMDSWYSSPFLFKKLDDLCFFASGYVQQNRKFLPEKEYFYNFNNSATTDHLNLIT